MMRKISAFILMMLLMICTIWATNTSDSSTFTTGNTNGLSDYKPTAPYSEFTIKAYKNTPDPVMLKVYDALTISLDEMSLTHNTINITPFLESFLGTGITKINDPANQILFSFIVTGASTGSFVTTVTVSNFAGPYTSSTPATTTPSGRINAYYQVGEVDYLFSQSQSDKNESFMISGDPAPVKGKSTVGAPKGEVSFSLAWTIKPKPGVEISGTGAQAVGEYWMATGSLMMQLDKSTFENSSTGDYRANVTVTLAPGA